MTNLAFPRAWRIIGTACRTSFNPTRLVESWLKSRKNTPAACDTSWQISTTQLAQNVKSIFVQKKSFSNHGCHSIRFLCQKKPPFNESRPPTILPRFQPSVPPKEDQGPFAPPNDPRRGTWDPWRQSPAVGAGRTGGSHGAVANHSRLGKQDLNLISPKKQTLSKKYLCWIQAVTSSHLQNYSRLYLFKILECRLKSSCFLPYHAWCFQSTHLPTPSWQ